MRAAIRKYPLMLLLCLLCASTAVEAREPSGKGFEVALIGERAISVYTYRPRKCNAITLLFVFAGYHRNADDYRDRATPLADRACLLVLAPELDRKRFPNWRYQRAGVIRKDKVQSRRQWTGPLLDALIAWGRRWSGNAEIPYLLFGHSAGAQFLSRIAAYSPPPGPKRIVIANPSAHVLPSKHEAIPFGFAGLDPRRSVDEHIRTYLSLPITIYLGEEDRGEKLLVKNAGAMRQGANRYERGRFVFQEARRIAQERSWPFAWKLVVAPNVGHSSSRMLASSRAEEAFGLLEPASMPQ